MSFVQIGIPQKDDVDGNKVKKKKKGSILNV